MMETFSEDLNSKENQSDKKFNNNEEKDSQSDAFNYSVDTIDEESTSEDDTRSETNTVLLNPNEEENPAEKNDSPELEVLTKPILADFSSLSPLTRKKIVSLQNCPTLSFADSEEGNLDDDSSKCKENLSSQLAASSDENDGTFNIPAPTNRSSESESSCLLVTPDQTENVDLLSSTSTGTIIPRSVSFNDRLIGKHEPQVDRSNRSVSNETLKEDDSSAPLRRLISTPGRLQTTKVDASCGSKDSSAKTPGGGKRTIKNLTSNLARKLSMKSKKTDKKMSCVDSDAINGLPFAETAGIVSYEALLRLFECPGCDSMISPPFAQCKKGHLICDKCRTTFKATCPTCKQRITENPNYMMSQVYNLVRFPCQFLKYGCLEYHPPKQKMNHEQFCHHRPIYCHFESYGCNQFLSLKYMQKHILECPFKPCRE